MPEEDSQPSETPKTKAKSKSTKAKTGASKLAKRRLHYAFKEGEKYVYEVEIVLDLGDSVRTISGRSTYKVIRADDDEMVLEHDGHLVTRTQTHGGQPRFDHRHHGGMSNFPGSFGGSGQLTISTSGEVIKNTSMAQLPWLLGPLSMLVLEPLSPENEATWEVSRNLAVASKPATSADNASPIERSRQRMARARGQQPRQSPTTISAAVEKTVYTLGAAKGDTIKIKRHLELTPQAAAPGIPAMGKTSDGEITFDTKAGVPKKATLKETLQVAVSSAMVAVPLTVTCRLLSSAEVAKLDQEAVDRKAESDAKIAEMNRPLDDKDVRRLIQELKVPDKRRAAADRLAKGPANDMRDQVAKALGALLNDPDNGTRKTAVVALGVWATSDSVPALIPLLEDDDIFLRSDVMKTLGKLADERGAEAVAKHFFADRHHASEALKAMGQIAEPHVVPLLEDREEGIRVEACKILGAIGTEKSRSTLETLAKKGKGSAAREAERALRQIASRQ